MSEPMDAKRSERKTLPVVLHDPKVLLVGAGSVAEQKATALLRNAIVFDVIALAKSEGFSKLGLPVRLRAVEPDDLQGYDIVIDATGSGGVAQMLLKLKPTCRFMLNVVDRPDICDFFFAALIEEGPLKIAVSSSGGSPALAQAVRDKIRRFLPAGLKALATQSLEERLQGVVRPQVLKAEAQRLLGNVWLIGCGTGDPELLTLKAYRRIQEADVALIDHLISEEIVSLIPDHVEKVYVGKRKGVPGTGQASINRMLVDYALQGRNVARLKSGDPYVFGRGSEEAVASAEAGLHVEVIPGISSAVAGPASAGIAPTARGYATGMSIVSAHLAGNRVNLEWLPLLKMPNHTTIVLMGLSRVREIVEAALKSGASPALKAAIVSDASRPTQECVISTLAGLETAAAKAHQPAIIVFGNVVALREILPESV